MAISRLTGRYILACERRAGDAGGSELVRGPGPPRDSHPRQGARRLRGRDDDLRPDGGERDGLGGRAARARRRPGRRRRTAVLQLPASSWRRIFAANYLGAIAMPINWRLAAPEVRYILEHSQAKALVCDDDARRPRQRRRRPGWTELLARVCIAPPAPNGWTAAGRPARGAGAAAAARRRRRRPPADVHLRHHRAPERRHAHACEPGLEEPRASRGVRLHQRRSRARLRPALPRRRARSHDHVADRRRGHDDHPSRRSTRRAVVDELERSRVTVVWLAPAMVNAIMALPGIEQRDLSSVRARHQRRREDADPAHRTDPADVPLRLVRRRVRPHRDRLRRHLPRPRQHRHQARQRRPSLPASRTRHLGRGRHVGRARGSAARS